MPILTGKSAERFHKMAEENEKRIPTEADIAESKRIKAVYEAVMANSKKSTEKEWITLNIEPIAASRPRFNRKTGIAYTAGKYDKYKKDLIFLCKRIPKNDYCFIELEFHFAYPKSTPKKHLIDGVPHRKKIDLDNAAKGALDALEQAGVFENDSRISDATIKKRYTTQPKGFIRLRLHTSTLEVPTSS